MREVEQRIGREYLTLDFVKYWFSLHGCCLWYKLYIILPTEVESRTQGSRPRPRTKKNPRLRPRTVFSRTDPLEAKDRNAREAKAKDQGHKRKSSQKKKRKVFKKVFQAIYNSLA